MMVRASISTMGLLLFLATVGVGSSRAAELTIRVGDKGDLSPALQILLLLTFLSLAPALVMMLTSFTRIVVVLSLLRQAIGTHQLPPGQILIALSLFLTIFIMSPVWTRVNQEALQPYLSHQISHEEALSRATIPVREFMLRQTREKDILLFVDLGKMERPQEPSDIPMSILIPAFMISELKTAFQIGFLLHVPFVILDLVVSSLLLSMGMLMLPPVMISLPLKLMLFVLVDGWNLLVGSLVRSFM